MKAGIVLFLAVKAAKRLCASLGTPAGMECDAGPVGDRAMGGNPSLEVIGGQHCIGILCGAGSDIHDTERRHQITHSDFIH